MIALIGMSREVFGNSAHDTGNITVSLTQYWHDPETPPEIAELAGTFRERNPTMKHRLFSHAEASRFIAEHHTQRELTAFHACAVPAMQADYFRYCAVLAAGGLYADADFRCRRPLPSLLDQAGPACLFKGSRGQILTGLFLFREPNHPLLRLTLDMVTHNIEQRACEDIWSLTGPGVLNGLMLLHCRDPRVMKNTKSYVGVDRSAFESAGGHPRLMTAFEGVGIAPLRRAASWIAGPERIMKNIADYSHWVEWGEQGKSVFK